MPPPLVGGAFTSNWNDLTVGDLFERIRTTMPLDTPGRLSRQHCERISRSIVARLSKGAAGQDEVLTERREAGWLGTPVKDLLAYRS